MLAHAARADRPTRLWCVIASLVADLDGAPIVMGVASYQRWHHVLAHNFLFGAVVVAISTGWIGARPGPLALVALSFMLHLGGDYVGSGPGWGLWPLLPFDHRFFICSWGWDLSSWQNFLITLALGAATLWIALKTGRTPLEFVSANLDRAVVNALRLRRTSICCSECSGRAGFRCHRCDRPLCQTHVATWKRLDLLCQACVTPGAAGAGADDPGRIDGATGERTGRDRRR